MLKFRFDFIIVLWMIMNSGVVAQTTPGLILPEALDGAVKLHLSVIPNQEQASLGEEDLAIFVKNEQQAYVSNAIQGRYVREGDYLLFRPYFPFEGGMTYIVRTKDAHSKRTYSYQAFQIGQKKKVEEAKVVSIYPSAEQLPNNVLRFYIYFNTPMKKGQALKHIHLVDEKGNIDHHAFMEFKQELWSMDGKRLSLLFDPGRIKRGVSTNLQRGPALLEGKRYQLRISGAWQDVYGQDLLTETKKEIEVTTAYRHQIKVDDWQIDIPQSDSDDPLIVHFDRIIDHALIQSMIKIVDAKDRVIPGHWEIIEKEYSAKFIAQEKWNKGNYRMIIDSRLEDIAGNNLQNLLDHLTTNEEGNNKSFQYLDFKI